jgi:hypothetical protein
MTAISRLVEGGLAILLAHVFITARRSDALEFETLESNLGALHSHIGTRLLLTYAGDTF